MLTGKCDQCPAESSHLDLFAGQKLKCKKCPAGWVQLPQREGFVQRSAPAAVAPEFKPVPVKAVAPPKSPLPPTSDAFTLRVSNNGRIQTLSGTLTPEQNSTPIVVPFRGGGGG